MATVAERIELLHNNLAHVEAMGGEKRVASQHGNGKLTARERIAPATVLLPVMVL